MPIVPITTLGECRLPSPVPHCVSDGVRVPAELHWTNGRPPADPLLFEQAGPRERLYFDAARTCAGVVTCGGLSPGINNVIRSLFLQLYHGYGVRNILGFRGGYVGLDPARGREPLALTLEIVEDIHKQGGTILGTSRGPVDTTVAVDHLIRRDVNLLFTIGGDGTQRGSWELFQESRRRGHALSVVGVPKTIDNDVPFVSRTFGYLTALEQACIVIDRAHTEAHCVKNGISVVKLMGRSAGFIAVGATLASQDVNFCLIPEVPFALEGPNGFLAALKKRVLARAHAVMVIAEGAGQDLVADPGAGRDASGNVRLKDVGVFLRDRIEAYFKAEGVPAVMRYIDPSYLVRSCPANPEDAIQCDLFARHAVHAAMSGRTGLVIGLVNDHFVHVPIELLGSQKKQVDPDGSQWRAVLACTGQPARMGG
jgi:6-phosphofructokinase 1